MTPAAAPGRIEVVAARTLTAGTLIAVALVLAGTLLGQASVQVAGLGVMLATPAVQLSLVGIGLWRIGERQPALLALLSVGLLGIGILLALALRIGG